MLRQYPEVRRTIEEAKQRREAETKAASCMVTEMDRNSAKASLRRTSGLTALRRAGGKVSLLNSLGGTRPSLCKLRASAIGAPLQPNACVGSDADLEKMRADGEAREEGAASPSFGRSPSAGRPQANSLRHSVHALRRVNTLQLQSSAPLESAAEHSARCATGVEPPAGRARRCSCDCVLRKFGRMSFLKNPPRVADCGAAGQDCVAVEAAAMATVDDACADSAALAPEPSCVDD